MTFANALESLESAILHDESIDLRLYAGLLEAQRRQGLMHGDREICPFLRPHFISREQYTAMTRAAEVLAGAFEKLVVAALADDDLFHQFGLTEREARMARFDPGYPRLCVSSRLDSFITDDGFAFLEYNAETPAGTIDQQAFEKVFFELPYLRDFLDEHPHFCPKPHEKLLLALLATYRSWGGTKENPTIAIVDWTGVETTPEFEVLRDYFTARGCPTRIGDPHDLTYDGKTLRLGDFEIDIFYKRVIIHEYLAKFGDDHALARAYADGNVCMANSFRTKIPHKKAGFAVLSEGRYDHLFNDEELAVIRARVPWTRRVRAGVTVFEGAQRDLVEILKTERERLVLKPNDDYGGHGVFIGWETEPAAWDEKIAFALERDYVVQQRVKARKLSFPLFTDHVEFREMLVDFDPFLFDNHAEGALVRLSSTSLCNVSSGGGETGLVVLEDS
jgi:hypothetical protein